MTETVTCRLLTTDIFERAYSVYVSVLEKVCVWQFVPLHFCGVRVCVTMLILVFEHHRRYCVFSGCKRRCVCVSVFSFFMCVCWGLGGTPECHLFSVM